MGKIRIYSENEEGYKNLEKAAELLNERSPRGYKYSVGECYFDMGQDWAWTTIICDTGEGGVCGHYQALCPRDHELIIDGKIERAIDLVLSNKYCPDKA